MSKSRLSQPTKILCKVTLAVKRVVVGMAVFGVLSSIYHRNISDYYGRAAAAACVLIFACMLRKMSLMQDKRKHLKIMRITRGVERPSPSRS